jgi:RNA polymerase sigma-70 factor (sigma-E family)
VDSDTEAAYRASFDSFVATRGETLTRFAYLLTRDHHLAQDLTQEGLARLHRHWPKVTDFGDPDRYVRTIMLNQLVSWRRRRSWTERTTADLGVDRPVDADAAQAGADRDEMWTVLGDLPPQQRAVIVLRFYEDLDDDAIAELLGCAPATVRSHASKAIAKLRLAVAQPHLTSGGPHD